MIPAFSAHMCANAAVVKTDQFDPQAGLTFKGSVDLGKGYTFTGKEYVSVCSKTVAWSYTQISNWNITFSLGAVNLYRDKKSVSFTALKYKLPIGPHFVVTTEYYWIGYDRDWFNWGLLDYNFRFRGRDAFIGVYYELATPNAAYLQIGPHIGVGNYEIDLLLGKSSSAIRFCYTLPVTF